MHVLTLHPKTKFLSPYAMNTWLSHFAYRVNMKFWMFAASGVIALIIALLTISSKVIKAAVSNPADSLRYE